MSILKKNGKMIMIGNRIAVGRRGGASAPDGNPSALVATVVSDVRIDLSWTNGATNQDGTEVFISTNGINYTSKGITAGSGATFSATSLTEGTLYYFKVAHYKGIVYSSYSNVYSALTIELPSSITGINLWLKADDIEGSDGDPISSWTSNDSFNLEFTAATTKRPTLKKTTNGINGHNVLRFNGTANIMSCTTALNNNAGTMFAVIRSDSSQNNSATILSVADEATLGQKYCTLQAYNAAATPKIAIAYANGGSDYAGVIGSTNVAMSTVHLIKLQSDGNLTYKMALNRIVQTLSVSYSTSTARKWFGAISDKDNTSIGGSKQSSDSTLFKGDIAEIISYDSSLGDADVAKVEKYLSFKYGLENLYVFYGDSIVNGVGASDEAHSFRKLIANVKNIVDINSGINSTCLQNTVQNRVVTIGAATDNNGRDTYSTRVSVYKPNKVIILYGLNDLRLNDAAFSSANYKNDLKEIIQGIVNSGVRPIDIIIGSPSYMNNYAASVDYNAGSIAKHQDYVLKCSEAAAEMGCIYIDIYQWMVDNGGDSLIGADGIHPNDAGHDAIADAFLSVL